MISCALQENQFGETFTILVTFKCTFSYVCLLVYFKRTFFFSVCFLVSFKKTIWKNFSNFDHIYMALLQCVFSYVFEENLFWKTFTTLIKFIWLSSSVCFLVSFNRTFLGKKTFTILMIFRWLFSSMYFQMYFMRTFFGKKIPRWLHLNDFSLVYFLVSPKRTFFWENFYRTDHI